MRILVTNDDGIDSDGLRHLALAMRDLGEVTVAAPDTEYSGASAALGTLHMMQPEVHRASIGGLSDVWSVSGPPALCVMFARLGAFGPPFDLVVSGINPGVNVGRSVYHSGTVGAAVTARVGGVTGVAISQAVQGFGVEGQGWDEMLRDQCWEGAAEVAAAVVGAIVDEPPASSVAVNVNVPNKAVAGMAGWQRTTVGRVPPRVISDVQLEPKLGHPASYRVVMKWGDAVSLPDGTDGGAIERDLVSVTLLGTLTERPHRKEDDPDPDEHAAAVIGRGLDRLFESVRAR